MDPIVVGVDTRDSSRAALEFAADEARLRDVELVVAHVHASHPKSSAMPNTPSRTFVGDASDPVFMSSREPAPAPDAQGRRVDARRQEDDYRRSQATADDSDVELRAAIEEMIAELGPRRPDNVSVRILNESHAAKALVEAANDASMLVVGSRGRGGFSGLMLGSVSQQCAHHAQCPVVVVRES